MIPFSLFAAAKINLALHVLGRRTDGYHDLDSVVAFADVGDWLTFSEAPAFAITADGPFAEGLPAPRDNIIARAWAAATEIAVKRGKALPPVKVHVRKNLPIASGIGGGSSNAAAALRGFLHIIGIDSYDDEILAAALKLGADVPVCLCGKACRMRGVGEDIEPFDHFAPRHAVLVNPLVGVSTPDVFARLGLERGQQFAAPIEDAACHEEWRNDLENPAIAAAPVIADVLRELRKLPEAARVSMSGSGATCVALFDSSQAVAAALGSLRQQNPRWWITAAQLA